MLLQRWYNGRALISAACYVYLVSQVSGSEGRRGVRVGLSRTGWL